MASLHELPIELIGIIFRHLNRNTALSLNRACKSLYAITIPLIYHTICLTWRDPEITKIEQQPRIECFFRTVVTKPHLANAVKVIDFMTKGFVDPEWEPVSGMRVPMLDKDLPRRAVKTLSSLDIRDLNKWEQALADQKLDVVIASTFAHLPNITRVRLGISLLVACNSSIAFLPIIFSHMVKHGFKKLQEVCLGVDIDEYLSTFSQLNINDRSMFLPFFYCNSLRELRVMLPNITTFIPLASTALPHATNLTELRLQRTRADANTIAQILAVCPSIITLEYDYAQTIKLDPPLDVNVFVEALGSLKKLQHLKFILTPQGPTNSWPEYSKRTSPKGMVGGSLIDLVALKNLDISLMLLLGWDADEAPPISDVVPSWLQSFRIQNDCSCIKSSKWWFGRVAALYNELCKDNDWYRSHPYHYATPLTRDANKVTRRAFLIPDFKDR